MSQITMAGPCLKCKYMDKADQKISLSFLQRNSESQLTQNEYGGIIKGRNVPVFGFSDRVSGSEFYFRISIQETINKCQLLQATHERRLVRALKILINGTQSTQVLLKAKGDTKLHITSFIFVYHVLKHNYEHRSLLSSPVSTLLVPAIRAQRQSFQLHLNHMSKKLQLFYRLLS